jgi:hypothetical protein
MSSNVAVYQPGAWIIGLERYDDKAISRKEDDVTSRRVD